MTVDIARRRQFIEALVIPDGRRLGDVLEPWQRRHILEPLEEQTKTGQWRYRRAYIQLHRGAGKSIISSALALAAAALEDDLQIFVVGPDRQMVQDVTLKFLKGFIRRTPGLANLFEVYRDRILCPDTGSEIVVMSSDENSAWGLGGTGRGFMVLAEELWTWKGRDLWVAVDSATGKTDNFRVIVLSNAGYDSDTVAWQVHEAARTGKKEWLYYAPKGVMLQAIDRKWLAEQRRTLLPHEWKRLFANEWAAGDEEYISDVMLDRAFTGGWQRQQTGAPATSYSVGVDYGPSRDLTAIAVEHYDWDAQVVFLDELHVLRGSRKEQVPVDRVKEIVADIRARYQVEKIVCDPFQMLQAIQGWGSIAHQFTFNQGSKQQLGQVLLQLLADGRLRLYDDPALRRELRKLKFTAGPWGVSFGNTSDETDDRATALVLAAWWWVRPEAKKKGVISFGKIDSSGVPGRSAVGIAQGKTPVHWAAADESARAAMVFPKCTDPLGCLRYHPAEMTCRESVAAGMNFDKERPFRTRTTMERLQTGLK